MEFHDLVRKLSNIQGLAWFSSCYYKRPTKSSGASVLNTLGFFGQSFSDCELFSF